MTATEWFVITQCSHRILISLRFYIHTSSYQLLYVSFVSLQNIIHVLKVTSVVLTCNAFHTTGSVTMKMTAVMVLMRKIAVSISVSSSLNIPAILFFYFIFRYLNIFFTILFVSCFFFLNWLASKIEAHTE